MNIKEWLSKRPATKAAYIAAFTGLLTLVVVSFQTCLSFKQTELLNRQTEISNTQAILLSNQIEASTRPFVETRRKMYVNNVDTLIVVNKGQYPIQNISLTVLYFANIKGHGWFVSNTITNLPMAKALLKNDTVYYDLMPLVNGFKNPPMGSSFEIEESHELHGKQEYLTLLVSFERVIDGKSFLIILPNGVLRKHPNEISLIAYDENAFGQGSLQNWGNYGMELTYEYFKRTPFYRDCEIYNSSYLLGYQPTGKLGIINWVK